MKNLLLIILCLPIYVHSVGEFSPISGHSQIEEIERGVPLSKDITPSNQPTFEEFMEKGYLVHTGDFISPVIKEKCKPENLIITPRGSVSWGYTHTYWTLNHIVDHSSFLGSGVILVPLRNISKHVISLHTNEIITFGDYKPQKGDIILYMGKERWCQTLCDPSLYGLPELEEAMIPEMPIEVVRENFLKMGIDFYDFSAEISEERDPACYSKFVNEKLAEKNAWILKYKNQNLPWHPTNPVLISNHLVNNFNFFRALYQKEASLTLGYSSCPSLGNEGLLAILMLDQYIEGVVTSVFYKDYKGEINQSEPARGGAYSANLPYFPVFYQTALRLVEEIISDLFHEKNVTQEDQKYFFERFTVTKECMDCFLSLTVHDLNLFFREFKKNRNDIENRESLSPDFLYSSTESQLEEMNIMYDSAIQTFESNQRLQDQIEYGWNFFLAEIFIPGFSELTPKQFKQLKLKWPTWKALSHIQKEQLDACYTLVRDLKSRSRVHTYFPNPLPMSRRSLKHLYQLPYSIKASLYEKIYATSMSGEDLFKDHIELIRSSLESHFERFCQKQEKLHDTWALVPV